MGTRNLTMVVKDGEFKVAQYGQWDGYLEGNGQIVYDFIRNMNMEEFSKAVDKCQFHTEETFKDLETYLYTEPRDYFEQKRRFENYPELSRDTGAGILDIIHNNKEETLLLKNAIDFAGDPLMCEWAYLIDLDNSMLEIYTGFNQDPLEEGQRFAHLPPKGSEAFPEIYHPINMIVKYSFEDIINSTKDTLVSFVEERDAHLFKMWE